jgi:glutamyl-tRNA(Gln) amidotransferase subunit D
MKTSKSEKNAQPGDKVSIKTRKKQEKGILLKSHDSSIVLLKLDSGYNIGIKKQDIEKIRVIEKAAEEKEPPEIKHMGKNRIDIVMTGGTISSRLDSKTGGVKSLTKPKDLINLFPELAKIIDIRKIKVPFMKFSEDMQGKDWKKLAKTVQESLNDANCQGVIITHGTDFLHYTSAALSFMLQDLNKPVVLTYSQRSSDRGSSDAKLNLECSAYTALSDVAEVVLVGHSSINDDYCHILKGTKVRKMHTSRRDTFKPINCQPIGEVYSNGKIKILSEYNKRNNKKVKIDAKFSEKVALVKFYPGQNPNIIDYYVEKGYKGIIIETSGLGHVSQNLIPTIKKAIKKGVVVCAAAQTIFGRLDPYVYSTGRKLLDAGVVFLQDMLSETAYVKLAWLLGHKQKGVEIVKKQMIENKAKELNPQLGIEFL